MVIGPIRVFVGLPGNAITDDSGTLISAVALVRLTEAATSGTIPLLKPDRKSAPPGHRGPVRGGGVITTAQFLKATKRATSND